MYVVPFTCVNSHYSVFESENNFFKFKNSCHRLYDQSHFESVSGDLEDFLQCDEHLIPEDSFFHKVDLWQVEVARLVEIILEDLVVMESIDHHVEKRS